MTNTYPLSRNVVGRLPSSFTAPPSCNVPWIESSYTNVYYAASCSTTSSAAPHIESDPACYPDGWADAAAYAINSIPFYSPATACPGGFTAACSVTRNVFDAVPASITFGADVSSQIVYVLTDGETAVGCCPPGFACDTYWPLSCVSTPQPGETISGVTYGRSCASESATLTIPSDTSGDGLFPDLGPTADVLKVLILHNPATDNRTLGATAGGAGLSTGAEIGIGVGSGLAVIAVAVLLWVFRQKSKKKKKERARQQAEQSTSFKEEPVLPPNSNKAELKGSEATITAGKSGGVVLAKGELDANAAHPTSRTVETSGVAASRPDMELDASGSTTKERAEMDGQTSATIRDLAGLQSGGFRHELDAGQVTSSSVREI